MRANRTLEIGTGLFVLLGFAALFFLTTQLPGSGLKLNGAKDGYRVHAEFDNIGDLKPGSPVTMAGVRIGEVEAIRFNPENFLAVVTLHIDREFNRIPDDSTPGIQTQGLLGGKYVGISPGSSETFLKNGSQIDSTQTQSAIVLEGLINKFFSNMASRGTGDSNSSAANSADAEQRQETQE